MILLLLFICKDKLSGSYCLVAGFESPVFHICSLYYWRRQWHPIPVLLPGKSCGRRSLAGFSPWGRWESDTTEWLHFHFSLSCIGEGNGNPLQCSCLENPRDGEVWWAAIYGVAQSRTRLKWQRQQQIVLHTYCTLTLGELQSKPVKQIFPYTNIVDYFCQVWNK